jgi:Divergent InlB B-repeat domain
MRRRHAAETTTSAKDPPPRWLRRHVLAVLAVTVAGALPAAAGAASLTIEPNLLGSVTVEPAGAPLGDTPSGSTCVSPPIQPTQCSWDYPAGTAVTLTPVPDAAAGTFVGWSDLACAGMPICTLTLDDESTTATVTYSAMHLGIASPADITITGSAGGVDLSCPGQCDADLPYGTELTLTATPNVPTTTPIHWFRGCEEGYDHFGPTCTVEAIMNPWWISADLDGDTPPGIPPAIGVTFKVRKSGNGTVRGAKVDCGSTCSGTYDFGTRVSLSADPDPGWKFDHWDGGCGTDAACRLTLGPTTSVRAVFAPRAESAGTPPSGGSQTGARSETGAGSASAPTSGSSNPPSTVSPPLLAHLTFQRTGHGRTRRIVVAFDLARRAKVVVGLARPRAHRFTMSRSSVLDAGHRRLVLVVPRRLRAGAYRLEVRATAGGDHLTIARALRLRR